VGVTHKKKGANEKYSKKKLHSATTKVKGGWGAKSRCKMESFGRPVTIILRPHAWEGGGPHHLRPEIRRGKREK